MHSVMCGSNGVGRLGARSAKPKPATATGRVVLIGLPAAIVLLAFGLRLHGLGASSLWLDEILTATAAQLDLASIFRFHLEEAANPPLLSAIAHVFFACWGDSEFVARLPSALAGTLSILLVYKVGQALWTRKVALTGAFLMAVNTFHIQYSQEARNYALMVFLALLSLIFLIRALQRDSRGLWLGFILCTTLSLYNHYFAFLFLPAEVLYGATVIAERWFAERTKDNQPRAPHQAGELPSAARQALRFTISLLLVGISYLPWISTLQAQFPKQLQSPGLGITLATFRSSVDFLHTSLSTLCGATGALLGFWIVLLLWGMWTSGRKQMSLAAVWLLMPYVFLASVELRHPAFERYVIYTLPLLLLVASTGLMALSGLFNRVFDRVMRDRKLHPAGHLVERLLQHTQRGRAWLPGVLPALCVIILGLTSALSTRTYYLREKEDWRGAARYLAAHMGAGDIVIADGIRYGAGGDATRVIKALSYYLSLSGAPQTEPLAVGRPLWQGLRRPPVRDGDVWGVLWAQDDLPPADKLTEVDFHQVSIIRLRQPTGDAVQDTLSMLLELLDLLPTEAGFDVHLALADFYLRTGQSEQAELQLDVAAQVKPDHPEASRDLAATRAEMQELSSGTESMQRPLRKDFDDVLTCLGYRIHPTSVRAGTSLAVTLWWQATGTMDRDYTVFIHLTGEDDRIWAHQDMVLKHGEFPTSIWLLGERSKEEYDLELPPDTPPGEYTLTTGIYYWETGERLPVWDEDGARVLEDAILLGYITVE